MKVGLLPTAAAAIVLLGFGSCSGLRPATGAKPRAETVAPGGVFRAAAQGDLAALQTALARDPGLVQARDRGGWTAAAHAAWSRQKAAYDYLVGRGAATTVHTEAALGPLPALKDRLAAAPALAGSRDPVQKATPLHWAVRTANRLACELLLARGAPIDAADAAGSRPLHYAVAARDTQTAELLLRNGADPAAGDGEGRTGVHLAVEAGDFPMVALLLQAGCPIDARDRRGDTALHLAAARGSFELCEYLLAMGAGANRRNAAGRSPLDLARQGGHVRVVELLERQAAR